MANRMSKRVFTARWVMTMVAVLAAGACSGEEDARTEETGANTPSMDPTSPEGTNGGPTEDLRKIQPKISIHFDDTVEGSSPEGEQSLLLRGLHRKVPSAIGPQGPVNAGGSYTPASVTSIKIDVKETSTNNLWFTNLDLEKDQVTGDWSGTLPFLPQNVDLTFIAHAYMTNTDMSLTEIFSGSSQAQLSADFSVISVQLVPANNDSTNELPTVKQIGVPAEFASGKGGQVSFYISGKLGDKISYSITSKEAGSGTFTPASGKVTLVGTTATFFTHYTAPTVTDPQNFGQQITITNEDGNSVTSDFQTSVIPTIQVGGVNNTTVNVLFNPVINALNGYRAPGTGDVTWTAKISDDKPLAGLTYKWSFVPASGTTYNPPLGFVDDAENPALFENYVQNAAGVLTLQVKDEDKGVTTLHYNVLPKLFPDDTTGSVGSSLTSISAGGSHTCALAPGGLVRCWGNADSGQLGYGNKLSVGRGIAPYGKPYQAGDIQKLGKAQQIVTGANHTCALLDNGLVRCWGANGTGQLGYKLKTSENVGDGETVDAYGYVNLGGTAVKLASGGDHTCAIMYTGRVRCWGEGNHGQLGYGDVKNIGDDELPWSAGDVDIDPLRDVVDLAAGIHHTCALLSNGKVRCWGRASEGQLGYGNTNQIGDNEKPSAAGNVDIGDGGGAVLQIAAGDYHTCALLDTGNVRCWGYNLNGQLGYGNSGVYPVNTDIGDNETPASKGDVNLGGAKVIQIAAGGAHTCALLEDGQIKCWGLGSSGQLGYGTGAQQNAPPASPIDLIGTSAFYITAGNAHTCAVLATGAAWCWGLGSSGQLGYGNANNVSLPSATIARDVKVLSP